MVTEFQDLIRWTVTPQGVQKKNAKGEFYVTNPRPRAQAKPFYKLVVASIYRDEAHQDRLDTSATIGVLKSFFMHLPQNHNVHIHPMSGTLLTTGPSDIAQYIESMAFISGRRWRGHPELQNWNAGQAVELGKRWDKSVKAGDVNERHVNALVAKLQPLLIATVLRFNPKSNFLGEGAVVRLPPNEYHEIPCHHTAEWTTRLAAQKAEEDEAYHARERMRSAEYQRRKGSLAGYTPLRSEGITFHYRSRLYASFPYLMEINRDNKYTFTQLEWQEKRGSHRWDDETRPDPCLRYLKEISNSSGKLKEMSRVIRSWDGKKDGEGLEARMIFCSYFFTATRIMYLVSVATSGTTKY